MAWEPCFQCSIAILHTSLVDGVSPYHGPRVLARKDVAHERLDELVVAQLSRCTVVLVLVLFARLRVILLTILYYRFLCAHPFLSPSRRGARRRAAFIFVVVFIVVHLYVGSSCQ